MFTCLLYLSLAATLFPSSCRNQLHTNMIKHAAEKLAKAILRNDVLRFRSIFFDESWPHDLESLDYEQLVHKALKLGRKRIVNLLLEKSHLATSACQSIYDALLHLAVKKYGRSSGWCEVIVKLVSGFGARVASRDEAGNTAVHLAFLNHATDRLVDQLLRRYEGEDVANDDGLSVLHVDLDVVERLCGGGHVDVNRQVSVKSETIYAGYTPLHFAVEHRRLNVANYLLNEGASVNVQDANGSTPLHWACYRRDVEMIDLLHSYDRLNANVVDNFGFTHFMTACAASDVLLPKKYLLLAEIRSESSPSSLIDARAKDLDTFPYGGYTPLHFAADFGRLETVKLLLKLEADCCATTTDDFTPLALAQEHGHNEIRLRLAQSCSHIVTRDVIESEEDALDINFNEVLSFSDKFQSTHRDDVSLNDTNDTESFITCVSDSFQ